MPLSHRITRLALAAKNVVRAPLGSLRRIAGLEEERRGSRFARTWPVIKPPAEIADGQGQFCDNPLHAYFNDVKEGPGIWKWIHYFEPYHRHLQKFIGRPVTLVEIGVYSGGSLEMWKQYFGSECRVHGVDIEEACRSYEDRTTTIHIGDQADRTFWSRFKRDAPNVDVLIDDGGHTPEQQIVTLEEMLPHLRPGGVYICEDVHGVSNEFAAFAHSLAAELNAMTYHRPDHGIRSEITPFQSAVDSIHFYPYMVVIEKSNLKRTLVAPKHGTQWQPFRLCDFDSTTTNRPNEVAG